MFVPVVYKQSALERREGRHAYMNEVFVIEISVKAGEKGELYETSKHEVRNTFLSQNIWPIGFWLSTFNVQRALVFSLNKFPRELLWDYIPESYQRKV